MKSLRPMKFKQHFSSLTNSQKKGSQLVYALTHWRAWSAWSAFFWQIHETEIFHSSTVNDKWKHDATETLFALHFWWEKNMTLAETEKGHQLSRSSVWQKLLIYAHIWLQIRLGFTSISFFLCISCSGPTVSSNKKNNFSPSAHYSDHLGETHWRLD